MNIFLDGYFDRNFGDDMMMRLAAYQAGKHTFFVKNPKEEMLLPFFHINNIVTLDEKKNEKIDVGLKVTGSGFVIRRKLDIIHAYQQAHHLRKTGKTVPLAVVNCNLGPVCNRLAYYTIQKQLQAYQFISVRDKDSLHLLEKMHIKGRIAYHPDMLFSIPEEWIPPHTGEKCLGIAVYRNMFDSNLSCYRTLAQLADWYISHTHQKVLLFAFDMELENDITAAHTILSLSRYPNFIEIIPHIDDGTNIIRHFQRCVKIVGIRFHSILLALRLGIPVVPIAYSDKTTHMLEDISYEEKCFSWKNLSLESLIDSVSEAKSFCLDPHIIQDAEQHIHQFLECVIEERESW